MGHLEVIVAIFDNDTVKAGELLDRYNDIHDELGIVEAVAIVNEADKDPHVSYMGTSKTKGAGVGTVVGALIGVVGGPVGIAFGAAMGALGGAAVVAMSHIGVSKDLIETVESEMPAAGSALIVMAEADIAHVIVTNLEEAGAKIVSDTLTEDQLGKAHEISQGPYMEG